MSTAKTTPSGREIIRQALSARGRQAGNLAGMARDLGLSTAAVDAFVHGGAPLAPDYLAKLAERIWAGYIRYNADADRLESGNTAEPTTIAYRPPPPPKRKERVRHSGKAPTFERGSGGAPAMGRPAWARWIG
jgi:hypothetical protein